MSTPQPEPIVIIAWIERAIDGTAAGQHLRGTIARVQGIPGVYLERVIADMDSPDGREPLTRKLHRLASLVLRTALAARRERVLVVRHHPLLLPALLYWRLRGGKIVSSVQGSLDDLANEYPRLGKSKLVRRISVASARSAHVLVAGAPVITDHIRHEMASRSTPVIPLANGVFVRDLASAADEPSPRDGDYVVFVGNLAAWQGIDVMARAVQHEAWPHGVPLVVVGDGVERRLLEGIPNVELLGRLPSREAAVWYAHATCALSMKKSIGSVAQHGYWPFKLIESAAVGVPIVCSDAKGMAEAAQSLGNGVVVPAEDEGACARAVRALVSEPERRAALAAAGRIGVQRFDWSSGAPTLLQAIQLAQGEPHQIDERP